MSLDNNSRIIWYFTIGISNDNSVIKQNFKNAVFEITEEITKITGGVTYEYCYGTWKDDKKDDKIENNIEHDISVRISVIVLPDIADDVYNSIKQIISRANETHTLGINHIQAVKTYGFSKHFIV
jgi:hypothetical protein